MENVRNAEKRKSPEESSDLVDAKTKNEELASKKQHERDLCA
nr:DExH-box ATP-dependent RNA helicase DExH10-like [Tanacetum cinerariifolium]